MVGVAGLEGISFCCPHSPVPTAFSRPRSKEESGQENRNGCGRRVRRNFILLSPFFSPPFAHKAPQVVTNSLTRPGSGN